MNAVKYFENSSKKTLKFSIEPFEVEMTIKKEEI